MVMAEGSQRQKLKEKQRIVIKIGSSSLTHKESGDLNLLKMEQLVRIICDLKGTGRQVVLVSSGAIAAGRQALHCKETSSTYLSPAARAVLPSGSPPTSTLKSPRTGREPRLLPHSQNSSCNSEIEISLSKQHEDAQQEERLRKGPDHPAIRPLRGKRG